MVLHIGISAGSSEIPDKQSHRVGKPFNPSVGPFPPVLLLDQITVHLGRIRIEDHQLGLFFVTSLDPYTGGFSRIDQNLIHLNTQSYFHPAFLHQSTKCPDHRPGSASGKPNTPLSLKVMYQAVY